MSRCAVAAVMARAEGRFDVACLLDEQAQRFERREDGIGWHGFDMRDYWVGLSSVGAEWRASLYDHGGAS